MPLISRRKLLSRYNTVNYSVALQRQNTQRAAYLETDERRLTLPLEKIKMIAL